MDFEQLIRILEVKLGQPLPGQSAHLKMSPQPVDFRRFEPVVSPDHRKSGVLILFYPDGDRPFFPLIKRPEYLGVHSGQVSFPGGKMEQGDADIIDTALREAEEEVGISRSDVKVIGRLTDLFIPTSKFLVSPVLGFCAQRPKFIPEEKEVSRVISTDFLMLLDPEVRKQKNLKFGQNYSLETPYFDIEGEMVWGATAMILSELLHLIQEPR